MTDFKIEDLCLHAVDVEGIDPFVGRVNAAVLINEYLQKGELPPSDLIAWFGESVGNLQRGFKPKVSQAVKQRLASRSFGFTPRQKQTDHRGEGYDEARAIEIIKVMEKCNTDEAIDRYEERVYPHKRGEKFASLRQKYYRHKDAVAADVEAWLGILE